MTSPLDEPCPLVLTRRQMIVMRVACEMMLETGVLRGTDEADILKQGADELQSVYEQMPAL